MQELFVKNLAAWRLSNMRRITSIALILIGAGCVSWWSSRNESHVVNHIQEEVAELIPRFMNNPNSIKGHIVEPALERHVGSSLKEVHSLSLKEQKDIFIVVNKGDDMLHGDGTATHVAVVGVGKNQVACFRVVCQSTNEPLLISGVFLAENKEVKK